MRERGARGAGAARLPPDLDRARRHGSAFAERQLVAIAKALRRRCRIFILDEPTAALEKREIERLFAVLERMKAQGTAIIYISHRLDEVVALADRCTVLRDGKVAAVSRRGAFAVGDLVDGDDRARCRRESSLCRCRPAICCWQRRPTSVATRARARARNHRPRRACSAAAPTGSCAACSVSRERSSRRGPVAASAGSPVRPMPSRAGIGMVPGERALGLVMNQSVRDNILLPNLDALSPRRLASIARAGDRIVAELMELLDIRPRRPELPAGALSGGNQQKVILAKWLARARRRAAARRADARASTSPPRRRSTR